MSGLFWGGLAAGIGLGGISSGCAGKPLQDSIDPGAVAYPQLSGQKVQPPPTGCYLGFHGMSIDYYRMELRWSPKIVIPKFWNMQTETHFNRYAAHRTHASGAIPYFYRSMATDIQKTELAALPADDKFNRRMEAYAEAITTLGKPLFLTTLRGSNAGWHPWGRHPRAAKTLWRHIWSIFEDKGANAYTTWVWEIYCPFSGSAVDSPLDYYPGDDVVDWIGLAAFSRARIPPTDLAFEDLVTPTYAMVRSQWPAKPVMMSAFGRTWGARQPQWIEDAYRRIRFWNGMKAAVYWDSVSPEWEDIHSLRAESLFLLRKLPTDPYFIVAG